jgi:hypothetical protein
LSTAHDICHAFFSNELGKRAADYIRKKMELDWAVQRIKNNNNTGWLDRNINLAYCWVYAQEAVKRGPNNDPRGIRTLMGFQHDSPIAGSI